MFTAKSLAPRDILYMCVTICVFRWEVRLERTEGPVCPCYRQRTSAREVKTDFLSSPKSQVNLNPDVSESKTSSRESDLILKEKSEERKTKSCYSSLGR